MLFNLSEEKITFSWTNSGDPDSDLTPNTIAVMCEQLKSLSLLNLAQSVISDWTELLGFKELIDLIPLTS